MYSKLERRAMMFLIHPLSTRWRFAFTWIIVPTLLVMWVLIGIANKGWAEVVGLPEIQFTGNGMTSTLTTSVDGEVTYSINVTCPAGATGSIVSMDARPLVETGRCGVPRGTWVGWHSDRRNQLNQTFTDPVSSCLAGGDWHLVVRASCGVLDTIGVLRVNILPEGQRVRPNASGTAPNYVFENRATFRSRAGSGTATDHVYQLQVTGELNMSNLLYNLAAEALGKWNHVGGHSYGKPEGLYTTLEGRFGSSSGDVSLNTLTTNVTRATSNGSSTVTILANVGDDWRWRASTNPSVGLSRAVVIYGVNDSKNISVTLQTTAGSISLGSSPAESLLIAERQRLAGVVPAEIFGGIATEPPPPPMGVNFPMVSFQVRD